MKAQDAVIARILELAKQKNLSINKIATNSFMNTSTLTSLLNGHSKKSEISTISKVCYGLGISIPDFFSSPLFYDVKDIED